MPSFPNQTTPEDMTARGLSICRCLSKGLSGKRTRLAGDLTPGEYYHALKFMKRKHGAETVEHLIYRLTKEGLI